MGKLERAKLYALDPDTKCEIDENGIDVCFNPKDYTLDKTLTWKERDSWMDSPVQEFKAPNPITLTVILQFDTYEERVSVREKYLLKIEKLTRMRSPATSETDIKSHSPPLVLFIWGKLKFQGVIESLNQKYTMFLSDGTPVRAECTIKIRNAELEQIDVQEQIYDAGEQLQTYKIKPGDTLWMIAATFYGDAGKWDKIAKENGLEGDLKTLPVGKTIRIPE